MRALAVCTNTGVFPSKGSGTGIWLGEIVSFFDELTAKKIYVDIVSPKGGLIPLDPRSIDTKDEGIRKYTSDEQFTALLNNSRSIEETDPLDYFIVYLVGGHGAMWDFPDNQKLQEVVKEVFESGGMITAIGHGVSGLLNVRLSDGSLFVRDRYLTGYTNMEEKLTSFVNEVPFYLEDLLIERGAQFTKSMIPFTEHIELDERLITGQNPNSARKVAKKLLEEIWEK